MRLRNMLNVIRYHRDARKILGRVFADARRAERGPDTRAINDELATLVNKAGAAADPQATIQALIDARSDRGLADRSEAAVRWREAVRTVTSEPGALDADVQARMLKLLDARKDLGDMGRAGIEAVLDRASAELQEMRPPASREGIHNELQFLFARYAGTTKRYLGTMKDSDVSAIRRAAVDLESVRREFERWRRQRWL